MWSVEVVSAITLLAWIWLILFRSGFWRTDMQLRSMDPPRQGAESRPGNGALHWPKVCAVVPARNEADILPETLPALLAQAYPGEFTVILVDDHSGDGTSEVAQRIAAGLTDGRADSDADADGDAPGHTAPSAAAAARDAAAGAPISGAAASAGVAPRPARAQRLTVVQAPPLPAGWAGKVWALQSGLARVPDDADFVLFTDADIHHPPRSVHNLVAWALADHRDLVSLMVRLKFETFWGSLMIPAFVYFFAKLYPFRQVAKRGRSTAAAAGGCILVRRSLVTKAGGLAPIAGALIDDCALAGLVQRRGGSLWLGLGTDVTSIRPYPRLADIWAMVARSAFVQLRYSAWLLAGTVIGMIWLYVWPVAAGLAGLAAALASPSSWSIPVAIMNLLTWALIGLSFAPMLRWYQVPAWRAALLPAGGLLYTLMTVDSARRFWLRRQGGWKGRPYQPPAGQAADKDAEQS